MCDFYKYKPFRIKSSFKNQFIVGFLKKHIQELINKIFVVCSLINNLIFQRPPLLHIFKSKDMIVFFDHSKFKVLIFS